MNVQPAVGYPGYETMVFSVTDLKQYFYCPRIPYFTYVQPVRRKVTAAMERGADEHERLERLEPRRTVKRYGLEGAERRFRVRLFSPTIGLSGQLDLLLVTENSCFPVEFKHTRNRPGANHRMQLSAYAMLAEEEYETKVETGFFCVSPENLLIPAAITDDDRRAVSEAVGGMRHMVLAEHWPDATKERGKCVSCEWRNFCNDLW